MLFYVKSYLDRGKYFDHCNIYFVSSYGLYTFFICLLSTPFESFSLYIKFYQCPVECFELFSFIALFSMFNKCSGSTVEKVTRCLFCFQIEQNYCSQAGGGSSDDTDGCNDHYLRREYITSAFPYHSFRRKLYIELRAVIVFQ